MSSSMQRHWTGAPRTGRHRTRQDEPSRTKFQDVDGQRFCPPLFVMKGDGADGGVAVEAMGCSGAAGGGQADDVRGGLIAAGVSSTGAPDSAGGGAGRAGGTRTRKPRARAGE